MKKVAFTEMVQRQLVRKSSGGKLLVSVKYQNLHSFEEGMIHLCQSILETRHITSTWFSSLYNSFKRVFFLKNEL